MKGKGISKKLAGIYYIIIVFLICALTVVNWAGFTFQNVIGQYLGQTRGAQNTAGNNLFTSAYTNYNDLIADQTQYGIEVQKEGSILLQNDADNGGLPLSENERKVTLLGFRSNTTNIYNTKHLFGTFTNRTPEFDKVFTDAGFEVNETAFDYFETLSAEESVSNYPEAVKSSVSDYSDVGIIVIGRKGTEGSDIQAEELDFTDAEKELIEYAIGNFNKVVILLNSSTAHAMSLGWLEDKPVSVLWIGMTGEVGLQGIPEILTGDSYPSGKTTDTMYYDAMDIPAMLNSGDLNINGTNEDYLSGKYVNYSEGIYVGYRYFETRYADKVMGSENVGEYDYAAQVQHPFGYGLTYTTFEQSNFELTENEDSFTASVTVKNTGDRAGRDVVQIYMQSPYTEYDRENGIEKSAIQLVGFCKTEELQPGEEKSYTVEISKEELKTYDKNNAKTYIVEAGDYYFTAGTDVHNALNNILAAEGYTTANGMTADGNADMTAEVTYEETDTTTYATGADGNPITNQFEDASLGYYYDNVVYLSRNDWVGTYPVQAGDIDATDKFNEDLAAPTYSDPDAEMPTTGEDNGMKLASMTGKSYDDPDWDKLLDQMTAEDLMKLVGVGAYGSQAIASVQKPYVVDQDAGDMINASVIGGDKPFVYPTQAKMATSFNTDLADQMGAFIGEDCLYTGVSGWYSPGTNMHRTPTGGRNLEYASEDPFMDSEYVVHVIKNVQDKGTYCYVKHFALNDQETNRSTISVFAEEQSIREIYLRPFEKAVTVANARGIMNSMNRIGAKWTGSDEALLTNVCRNEWGFEGIMITDAASASGKVVPEASLMSGNDLFLVMGEGVTIDGYESDPMIMQALRQASHRILYTVANSNAMNGFTEETVVHTTEMLPYQKVLIVVDVVVYGACLAGLVYVTLSLVKQKKRKEK